MIVFPKLVSLSHKTQPPKWLNLLTRNTHFLSQPPPTTLSPIRQNSVAIFWDLDNKPPEETPYIEAAESLKRIARSFGLVHLMMAYGNQRTLSVVPKGKPRHVNWHYKCEICGRSFVEQSKLLSHFKTFHTTENRKRLVKLEQAKRPRRIETVRRYVAKIEKYNTARMGMLCPLREIDCRVGQNLGRAGFRFVKVNDAVEFTMGNDIAHLVSTGRFGCVVIVSDCSRHFMVLKEAKAKGVKTVVVVGPDAALKSAAHKVLSWRDVMVGKVDPLFDDDDDNDDSDDGGLSFGIDTYKSTLKPWWKI